ncbi:DNA damage-inducible transcript 4-like protein [Thalassophryne amazonica]|uniref:DNA damage-inducible transcript 4-like protein n=1 Tax=Thalassophryne amazonica TaxID=390379 RepID=UPI00147236D0|nr:DNA damage-inducible transcript 4-like protein [Thalassophryne amazonica]
MVYTTGLLFGHGMSVVSEEERVADVMENQLFQRSLDRRGSVDSCDDTDSPPFADEELLQQGVTQQIERCLTEAKASKLQCQVLLLPRRMTARVGQDVVRSSLDEPCGLRGAAIMVYVEGKDGLTYLGSIFPDPNVTPTFELSMVFKADKDRGWPPLKQLFEKSRELKLRSEYRLVKRKLYSSASPVICDFN